MNTGSAIETERLFLLPSRTDRDSEAFLQMLRKLGFREVEDGPIMVVLGNIFEKEDNFFAHKVVKLLLTKEEFSDGN